MIDVSVYLSAAVQGVPLLFAVFVLVEVLKQLKKRDGSPAVTGNALLISSLVIGFVIGMGYIVNETEPPSGPAHLVYQYWFAAAVYSIGLGGMASLFWEGLKALVYKAVEKVMPRPGNGNPPGTNNGY